MGLASFPVSLRVCCPELCLFTSVHEFCPHHPHDFAADSPLDARGVKEVVTEPLGRSVALRGSG